jgi:hypothetical protein
LSDSSRAAKHYWNHSKLPIFDEIEIEIEKETEREREKDEERAAPLS